MGNGRVRIWVTRQHLRREWLVQLRFHWNLLRYNSRVPHELLRWANLV